MGKTKGTLNKHIFRFITLFITVICLFFGVLTYEAFNYSLYKSYDKRMMDIVQFVHSHIDEDDLYECVQTGVESEKFVELMSFMDSIMEDFHIHYLYIVTPVLEEDRVGMINIISADTAEGRENDPDGYYLNFFMDDVYELNELKLYQDAMNSDKASFFKNFTVWGYDYTAAIPLINSKGEHFAVLCVDIQVEDIQRAVQTYTLLIVILIIWLGAIFAVVSNIWLNHNISEPIRRLEKSVVDFAERSHEQTDPDLLSYDDPNIHTSNEVESLSDAIMQMTVDMRTYVKNILEANDKVEDMKTQVTYMDMIAHQDALTHVKNKAWYDEIAHRIDAEIKEGRAQFAILMADLNNLKKINDNYGHEHGNDYISGACHEICVVYEHSPVFRIGGDEFVVLLQNLDYDNRDKLLIRLREVFAKSYSNLSREPWERFSVAVGQAVFDSATDNCMNDVFKRADELMYKDKMSSKMGRG